MELNSLQLDIYWYLMNAFDWFIAITLGIAFLVFFLLMYITADEHDKFKKGK